MNQPDPNHLPIDANEHPDVFKGSGKKPRPGIVSPDRLIASAKPAPEEIRIFADQYDDELKAAYDNGRKDGYRDAEDDRIHVSGTAEAVADYHALVAESILNLAMGVAKSGVFGAFVERFDAVDDIDGGDE